MMLLGVDLLVLSEILRSLERLAASLRADLWISKRHIMEESEMQLTSQACGFKGV